MVANDELPPLPVWAITTFRRTATEVIGKHLWRERRTVGFYTTKDLSCAAVEGNYGDLEECGWYQFAVVEPIRMGLYPINQREDRVWYEFIGNREDGQWVKLEDIPQILLDEFGVGKPGGPKDFTNWTTVG